MNGVLILDKPPEFTSFDAVAVVRRLSGEKKIGHTGTLDPLATGVLPLLLGRAAKAADLLPDTDKEYLAGFRLGERRDTGDLTGTVVGTDGKAVSREALEQAMEAFRGEILQIPPMYSAVSVGGKRLYQLARQGIQVERAPRPVTVHRLTLLSYEESTREGTLTVSCSRGTYVRVLIEDLAAAAGTLGTMTSLRRTRACGFSLEDALSLDRVRALAEEGALERVLRPVESLFSRYPAVTVTGPQAVRFENGGALSLTRLRLPGKLPHGAAVRVYGPEGSFSGLGRADWEKEELGVLKLFREEGKSR